MSTKFTPFVNVPNTDATIDFSEDEVERDANKVYVAWTFDDGPIDTEKSRMTQKFLDLLKAKQVAATFYVVRSRKTTDDWKRYLETFSTTPHEIAIHEGFTDLSRHHVTIPKSGINDHLRWFPAPEKVAVGGSYHDIKYAMEDIHAFKSFLETQGRQVNFVRPPGGLASEVADCLRYFGFAANTTRDALPEAHKVIDHFNEVMTPGTKSAGVSDPIWEKLIQQMQTMRTSLNDEGLRLWGGKLKRKPEFYSYVSWDSEAKDGRSTLSQLDQCIASLGTGNPNPYLVILCHDTSDAYYRSFESDLNAMFERERKKIVEIEFVTMSQLYEQVTGKAPHDAGEQKIQKNEDENEVKVGAYGERSTVSDVIRKLLPKAYDICVTFDGQFYRVFVRKSPFAGAEDLLAEVKKSADDNAVPAPPSEVRDFSATNYGEAQSSVLEIDSVVNFFAKIDLKSYHFLVSHFDREKKLFKRLYVKARK